MLGVRMHTTIKTLFQKGYNKTQISKMLQIDRKTVRRILKEIDTNGAVERKERVSMLDPYKEFIHLQVSKDLSATRIFQDMVTEFDFNGSYDTVKKYVSKIRKKPQAIYMVLNSLPGEEAQVDFGYIGTIKLPDGRRRKAWIFVMELSFSRYMYVHIVFDQTVKTFIDCHKRAFRYFNGVPRNIKIDNLKAAILETDFYEPVFQRTYASFANYYGFLAEPCRIYTPTDKGKVESNIKYVKDNCFKARDFEDIDTARIFLKNWLEKVANVRVHGTTKHIPMDMFNEEEKQKLLPLPKVEYVITDIKETTVYPNCHISCQSNYYSVPYQYVGETVSVVVQDNLVKIFHKEKEIALHPLLKDEKGKFQTDNKHYPDKKTITTEEIKSRLREEMSQIGVHALQFYDLFMDSESRKYEYRSISGILSLRKKYDDKVIDSACQRAYTYGALKYKTVKNICEKGIEHLPLKINSTYLNQQETSLLRPLFQYSNLLLNRREVK